MRKGNMDGKTVIELHSATLLGTRERQEDYCVSVQTPERTIAIVCDGMGGMNAGDIASRTAAEALLTDLEKVVLPQDMDAFFQRELEKLDDVVYRLKAADGHRLKAGTTIVAVLLWGRELFWFSVGDSKLFCMRQGEIHCVTREHNYAMLCEMQSEEMPVHELHEGVSLNAQGYNASGKRGIRELQGDTGGERLVSYLGMGIAEIYDGSVRPFLMKPGDKLLLCTDGLYRTVEQGEIARILASTEDVKAVSVELERAVRRKQKANQDNATWVVISIKGEDQG